MQTGRNRKSVREVKNKLNSTPHVKGKNTFETTTAAIKSDTWF